MSARASRVASDVIPVIEVVPAADGPVTRRDVRRTLHGDFGSLAGLFDVRIVDRLSTSASGK